MRSQGKGAPDAADCGLVDACGLCHRAGRPMSGSGRLALQRAYDDLFNLGIAQLAGLSGTRLIEQAVQSTLVKPAPPFTDCLNHACVSAAMAVALSPSVARKTMRARIERAWAVVLLRVQLCKVLRCSPLSSNSGNRRPRLMTWLMSC